jgi:hypothetical protein
LRVLAVGTPLWPAYGEAIARGDITWVRRTIVGSIVVAELVVLPFALVTSLNRCRRIGKDWDNLNAKALAFLRFASVRLMLRQFYSSRYAQRSC